MARIYRSRPIPADPWVIQTIDGEASAFLAGLPAPDFRILADPKALWATAVDDTDEGSIVVGGGGGTVATFVVSAEAHKRLKAHRFS